jgi:hypothetical protein
MWDLSHACRAGGENLKLPRGENDVCCGRALATHIFHFESTVWLLLVIAVLVLVIFRYILIFTRCCTVGNYTPK